jgi:SsrA-binding protein
MLLHRNEIKRLQRSIENKGVTLIPLRVFISENGKVKVEIGWLKVKNNTISARRLPIKMRVVNWNESKEDNGYVFAG